MSFRDMPPSCIRDHAGRQHRQVHDLNDEHGSVDPDNPSVCG